MSRRGGQRARGWMAGGVAGVLLLALVAAGAGVMRQAHPHSAHATAALNFAAPVDALDNISPTALATGDFRHNGRTDLVVGTIGYYGCDQSNHCAWVPASLNILLNDGHGGFTPAPGNPITIPCGSRPASAIPATPPPSPPQCGNQDYSAVVVGDFNGDGKLDLAVSDIILGNGTNEYVYILLGNGDGTFQQPTASTTITIAPPLRAESLAVGDFNGDGKLDLVVASDSSASPGVVSVLLGHGDGTFAPLNPTPGPGSNSFWLGGNAEPNDITVGDVNGDGKLDVVTDNVDSWGLGVPPPHGQMTTPFSAGIGTSYSVLLGDGAGGLSLVGGTNVRDTDWSFSAVTGDFDGDGKLDLARGVNGSTSGVEVLLGHGDGTFTPAPGGVVSLSTPYAEGITAADFNGDGKPDIAEATSDGHAAIFLNRGGGALQSPVLFTARANANQLGSVGILAADLTSDALPDLVVANNWLSGGGAQQPGHIATLLNTSVITTPSVTLAPAAAQSYATGGATYVTGATPINIGASESGTTIASVAYRVCSNTCGGQAYTTVSGASTSLTLGSAASGRYEIDAYATDTAGYGSAAHARSLFVTVDDAAPSASLQIGTPQGNANGQTQVDRTTPLLLTSADAGSGVASVAYRFYPQGSAPPAYTTVVGNSVAFNLGGADGAYEIDYLATDHLGNVAVASSQLVALTELTSGTGSATATPAATTAATVAATSTPDAPASPPHNKDGFALPLVAWLGIALLVLLILAGAALLFVRSARAQH